MGYMIEISESKMEHLAENAEKMLRYGGKVMECIEELSQRRFGERDDEDREDWDDEMGERGGYSRGTTRYGNRYDDMGERRGRSSRTGRYIRR